VAIVRPEAKVCMVEAHQRKAVFLKEASRHLNSVRVSSKRAEQLGEAFDWVVSRAVSYADLAPMMGRLAARAALLTGVEEPDAGMGFDWAPPEQLPWGSQRFLRIGVRRE
jgi:hypothetical protein